MLLARKHPVAIFYFLAFAISWAGFAPLIFIPNHRPLWRVFLLLPAIGPAIAALCANALSGDKSSTSSPWPRLRFAFFTAVPWPWYALSIATPAVLFALGNRLSPILLPGRMALLLPVTLSGILLTSLLSIAANPFEEIGWRGFALPRLEATLNPTLAALIVGVLWALWHIPLFFCPDYSMATIPFLSWSIGMIAKSVLYAWLFNKTRSLATVTLLHLSFNISGATLGTQTEIGQTAVLVLAAIVLVCFAGTRLGYSPADPSTLQT